MSDTGKLRFWPDFVEAANRAIEMIATAAESARPDEDASLVVVAVTPDMPFLVLDQEEASPEESLPYCVHGRTVCSLRECGKWVYLGELSRVAVMSGKVVPLCKPCADSMTCGRRDMITISDPPHAVGSHD